MRLDQSFAYQLPLAPETAVDLSSFQWRPKLAFETKQSRYIIKTAQTQTEFEDTIKLRTDVFLREFAGKTRDDLLDLEDRDRDADFLIIKDALSSEVLASYRLIASDFSDDFYSKTEFCIDGFLHATGRKLELSRACVRADRRSSGIFLHLLWRGLIEYIKLSDSRYLFGCSSVQYLRLPDLVSVYQSLAELGALSHGFEVRPQPAYRIFDPMGLTAVQKTLPQESPPPLPPLLLGYIKAGAKIYGTPAYDQDFGCLDLFTILDFENLHPLFLKRYLS